MAYADALADPLDGPALERLAAQRALHELLVAWAGRLPGLARGGAQDQARWAVLRAIRLDLPLLVAEPDLLFPCVANRVFWPTVGTGIGRVRRWIGGADPAEVLARLVEGWRASRRERGRGPWARSLRPPEVGLDGPLLEEYRGSFSRFDALRLELDHVAVGSERRLAWDRATGHEVAVEPQTPDRLVLDAAPGAREVTGLLRLRDPATGELVVDTVLPMDMGVLFGAFRPAASPAIFVVGWEGDAVGLICRLDPPYRRETWRAHCRRAAFDVTATPDGARVFVAAGSLVVLDGASGAIRQEGVVSCHRVAVDPAGRALATLDEGLVRIWDIRRLGELKVARAGVHINGVRAFSADGRRLVTGNALCDAVDGRQIAILDLDDGGRYLEGGPPLGGHGLGSESFTEIGAASGVRQWETASGALRLRRSGGGEGLGSMVAVHPQGERYAVAPRRGAGPLRLLRVSDGAELGAVEVGALAELRFTPDGGRLVVITASGALVVLEGGSCALLGQVQAHEGRVRQVMVSADGALIVTAGEDQGLALHGLDPLRLLGRRPGPCLDPLEIEGWEGFRSTPHARVGRRRGPLFEVVDRQTGARVAAIPTAEALVSDPTGARWAGGDVHVVLEDVG